MARLRWLIMAVAVLLVALAGYKLAVGGRGGEIERLAERQLFVTTPDKTYALTVEVAATPEQQERGLMFRKHMAENHGMVFLFPKASDGGFWMKNTKIPLSIAFFDKKGVIVRIMQMQPCTLPQGQSERCPVYYPRVAYIGALEVNLGWFAKRGVKEGDSISLGPWK